MRDREILIKGCKGRSTDPGYNWTKVRRQTFSNDAYYILIKFHGGVIRGTMRTLCNEKDLGKS